jgi:hypothetical protein
VFALFAFLISNCKKRKLIPLFRCRLLTSLLIDAHLKGIALMKNSPQDLEDAVAIQQTDREFLARAVYIDYRMQDVPAVYRELMPYTADAAELIGAEKAIRKQVEQDLLLILSPWKTVGPQVVVLDWSNVSGLDRATFGLENSRMQGVPAIVKHGRDPFGKLWRDYDEVKAAIANASRTAEWAAADKEQELRREVDKANTAYVEALNVAADAIVVEVSDDLIDRSEEAEQAESVKPARAALKAATDAHEAAKAELKRLRANPILGCAIIA